MTMNTIPLNMRTILILFLRFFKAKYTIYHKIQISSILVIVLQTVVKVIVSSLITFHIITNRSNYFHFTICIAIDFTRSIHRNSTTLFAEERSTVPHFYSFLYDILTFLPVGAIPM